MDTLLACSPEHRVMSLWARRPGKSLRSHRYVIVKLPDHLGSGTPGVADRGTPEVAIGAVGGEGKTDC